MSMHVERKHWYTQLPFSWGVEAILVVALLAGTAVAATQVRGRDTTITEQATIISQQTTTIGQQAMAIRQAELDRQTLGRLANLDAALLDALEAGANARDQGSRALAAGDYQGWEAALMQESAAQSRIAELRLQRDLMSYTPPT
jgi:hypothetical protein